MTKWIERYRREAEDRFRRLDAVLERMGEEPVTGTATKEAAS
jgi:ferritin-like metal-binding protein YciE